VLTLILEFSLKNKTAITILEEDSIYIQTYSQDQGHGFGIGSSQPQNRTN